MSDTFHFKIDGNQLKNWDDVMKEENHMRTLLFFHIFANMQMVSTVKVGFDLLIYSHASNDWYLGPFNLIYVTA